VTTVPDKRNVSKQRRAARNRQTRDARAARRENAVIAPSASSSSRTSPSRTSSSGSGSSRPAAKDSRGKASGRAPSGRAARPRPTFVAYEPPPPGLKGLLTSRRSGDRWVLAAFLLAIVSAVFALVATEIAADDRGEALPNQFAGLTIAAREAITGQSLGDKTVSMVSAYGPIAFMLVGTPILITAFALWANRRPDRGRVLTYCLIAMAGAVMLSATSLLVFLPVVALGIATFRVRKTDMLMPGAETATVAAGGDRGRAIEADTVDDVEDDDEVDETEAAPAAPGSFLDRLLGGGAAGGSRASRARRDADEPASADEVVDDEVVDADVVEVEAAADGPAPTEADPLAELEAELAAEAESERSGGTGDAASGSGSGRGRRKR